MENACCSLCLGAALFVAMIGLLAWNEVRRASGRASGGPSLRLRILLARVSAVHLKPSLAVLQHLDAVFSAISSEQLPQTFSAEPLLQQRSDLPRLRGEGPQAREHRRALA